PAYSKLADAKFQQNDFTNALANYGAVIETVSALAELKTSLFEPALYQSVRAAVAIGNVSSASNAVARLLLAYPKGFHTERAVLFAGQQISSQGRPAVARKIFSEFLTAAPEADLAPQVRLAIARTFEQEENWPLAIEQYDAWLAVYTNHSAR